jgi:serine/threonine protein kinase
VLVFPYYPSTLNTYLRNHAKRNVPKLNLYANFGSSNSSDSDSAPELVNNLPLDKATQIVKGIADGLAFLHSNGIIHRDIKPENIMFQNFDPNPIIIDFGICYKYPNNYGKEQPSKKICDVSTGIYRSPELVFGITDYSYGVDIWSFGILISLLFSKHVKPVFSNDDYGDFRLVSLIFKTFGTPTLDTWPEARKSPTFSRLEPSKVDPISVDTILPRADGTIKEIFQRMMIYESSRRLSASEISQKLTESEK